MTWEACSKNMICNVCKVSKRSWSLSLNYWLTKFFQQKLLIIVCDLKQHLEDVNRGNALNPETTQITCKFGVVIVSCSVLYVIQKPEMLTKFNELLLFRFAIFGRCLDVEMKTPRAKVFLLKPRRRKRRQSRTKRKNSFGVKDCLAVDQPSLY